MRPTHKTPTMNMHFKPLIAAGLVLAAAGAQAQADTGSLAGWNTLGDVVAQDGKLLLTTAYLDGFTDQPLNLSGQSAADIGLVEAGAGLPAYGLDLEEPDFGTEGSLVSQSFAVAAGDVLRFSWNFATVEDMFLDHAFAVINGQRFTLATTAAPGAGTQVFEYSFASAGTATLALGVIDTGDFIGVSTLTVGTLSVTAVPEPASWALWLGGLGLAGAARFTRAGRNAGVPDRAHARRRIRRG